MGTPNDADQELSPWWRVAVLSVLLVGFSILIYIAFKAYDDAPPIPERVVDTAGRTVFTGADILAGQQVFLKYGLMENGTIWGHGAYLGPDFSAEYLHTLALETHADQAQRLYGRNPAELQQGEGDAVRNAAQHLLKGNRYEPRTRTLTLSEPEVSSYRKQIAKWAEYFTDDTKNGGLGLKFLTNSEELRQLTAFFAWTAWAAAANRPGKDYSYTSNFPYDPLAGNTPVPAAYLWSALSLITLLAGTAAILFFFGKFNYLGWKGLPPAEHRLMLPGEAGPSQQGTVKFFVVVTLLFLAQVLVGAAAAHAKVEPWSFYGLDLYHWLPSNILRTWHLQLAIFWIATAYVGGGLLLASTLGETEPRGQSRWVTLLFWALVVVVGGSLLGELLGIKQVLAHFWFWFGHQGWEYLDLGRGWQVLLAIGLILWVFLLYRALRPAFQDPERREISGLFLLAALAIPVFYLPAFFFGSTSNYTTVDNWRFWIIHLWVEGFFELLVTVMVAVTFFRLGVVSRQTATRVIYLDAILFLGSGIVGTGHHWYWTGQSHVNMALSAMFSAMEVVPLTLLTLDAWDFIKVTRSQKGTAIHPAFPHKWTFYFLMAVGFWNFVGAGIFGFLINLPIISYFEVGTTLTPNHGHAALMGAFGMEAVALTVMAFRQVLTDEQWLRPEKLIRVSFWGLNIGLALMILGNLFPAGVMQLYDVLQNGYWHARGFAYRSRHIVRVLEWCRMPGDLVFIFLGVIPLAAVGLLTSWSLWRGESASHHNR
jgi:nitric oxide reductase subunit B|uniref:Nitric-oxide reductase large subunit n=1 Tax=Desulfobacca acetoxidans TaxID=60893 RepID=A0A7V6A4S5_9BACT